MAIERNTVKTYSHDTPMPEMGEEAAETVEIPVSILGGKTVSPGDVVRLEVVASDEGSGVVKVKYADSESEEPEMGGIEGAAAKFEE